MTGVCLKETLTTMDTKDTRKNQMVSKDPRGPRKTKCFPKVVRALRALRGEELFYAPDVARLPLIRAATIATAAAVTPGTRAA